jgi:hypothetical protein
MAPNPPPPIPAITRPAIIIPALVDSPHISVPTPKKMLLNSSPARREKMSVNLPARG